jgi:AraC-like DNA-binding protein
MRIERSAERSAMMITPDRVVYAGLLGAPSMRSLGSLTVYVARDTPFEIRTEGNASRSAYFAVVPPNCRHTIQSSDRVIWDILIEPECVNVAEVLRNFRPLIVNQSGEYLRIREAFALWLNDVRSLDGTASAIDQFFLGNVLKPRLLDERINRAAQLIRAQPCEQFFAAECARITGLSFSRFVHLFKEQIGMTFRAFCAWKRARAVLPYVTSNCNLTDLALQVGYPDSTHFSHSIRRIYGLRPRDIVAGSRRLMLRIDTAGESTPAEQSPYPKWPKMAGLNGPNPERMVLRAHG